MKIVKENLRKLILEMEKELCRALPDNTIIVRSWTDKLLEAIEDVNE